MNIVMVSRVQMNPYVRLLGNALQHAEPGVHCAYEEVLDGALVSRWQGRADILHIHWAELQYRSWSAMRSARKLAGLLLALERARRAGMHIVYTAHNVRRHDDALTRLDALADSGLYRLVDAVHVHDEEAKRELLLSLQPRQINVIAHGNYIGAYPDTCTAQEARRKLELDDGSFVFLTLGQIRPYKGIDELITAFRSVGGDSVRLIVAGHPHDDAYAASLTALARADARIRLHLRFVPDEDIQYYMHAADICVLPYRAGTTSGAAILCLSFGKPVIAPDAWPFRPLIQSGSGLLYTSQPDGLRSALALAPQTDIGRASTAALDVARSLDWGPISCQHLAVYKSL
jgi:beta-1,4-mannosyltransferase